MMMIIVHHFYTTFSKTTQNLPSILNFVQSKFFLGSGGVALFFILSGAVLIKNYNKPINNIQFYKKRLIRILTPQIIAFFICVSLIYIATSQIWMHDKAGFIISMLGLNFCNLPWAYFGIDAPWIVGEWFTAVIIFLYALFPLLKYLFLKHRAVSTCLILLIFLLNLKYQIMTGGNGYFSYTNGIALFWAGMLFETYKEKIYASKIYSVIIPLSVIILILNIPIFYGNFYYLNVVIYSCALFILLYKVKYSSSFTEFICKYNFELYLMHHRIFIVTTPIVTYYSGGYIQTLLIFTFMTALSCAAACIVKHTADKISSKLL